MTHARVLEQALGRGTVLPMRFGVVMEGPDEVRRRVLERPCRRAHRSARTSSQGKVEMRVRAVYEEEALMREIVESHPEIARRA